ncbi:MAG TPA: transglycosylase domain-containing protein [Candidatus Saccharimonadales bacterium]|nr:transglycosylase domain-containing protein [Candidatus Saccharimonadales bacterium]
MVKRKQPVRMNRYTNLAHNKPKAHAATAPKKRGLIGRFIGLSRKRKIIVIAIPIVAALILIPLITYIILANDIDNPERLMNRNNTGIVLEDMNGKPFYSVGKAEHRDQIPLDQISPNMKNALVASEDHDFYKHGGFSFSGIFRALFTGVGGGSTLTQQLVKNTLLSDQHSYVRKYQELFMSIAVEQHYSKDQILDMYLNSVFFGENAFGIEDAAKLYFGKVPKDLDLAESAMLVGVLPAPNAYSPISGNATYAKERQTTVLARMVTNGYITEEQKTAALAETLVYASTAQSINSVAPHFAQMVIDELSKKYGYETVMRSGYQVKTTLDLTAQQNLLDSVGAGMAHINAMGGSNASGIVIDPASGGIRALVGSANYDDPSWGKVNMVTTARQPGSSFKPIYYSNALADGTITPATVLQDKVIDFGGGYVPRDADHNEASRGQVTTRQALDWSLNIPSIHVMQSYGVSKTIQAAKNLGITTIDASKNYGLTLALGSAEVPLEQMAHAYAAFANQGQQYDVSTINQVEDKYGKNIFKSLPISKQVISKEGAYLLSSILSDNKTRSHIFGSSLTVSGHTVAVKTGTTNDDRDAWTIGYNPQYVVGVWVGNNDNTVMASGGSDMAGPIWRGTMTKLLSGKKDVPFVVPSGITQRQVCSGSGGLADKAGPNTYSEYFMPGALPTNSCQAAPIMMSVCDLQTGKVTSIDESAFDSTKQSKDTANCKAPTEQACNLSTGKVETINTSDFDGTKYSTDTANCKTSSNNSDGTHSDTVTACDMQTGQWVQIPQSQVDGTRYMTGMATCQVSH